jgi:uncharacterized RDD family membrane protein YckC
MTAEMPPGGWDRPIPAQPRFAAPLAGWWSRVAAALIDGLIVTIPAIALAVVIFGGVTAAFSADDGVGVFTLIVGVIAYLLLLAAVALLYAPLLMARQGERNGQTLGKQLLGIRVIRVSGEPMDFGWSALREVGVKGFGTGVASTFVPFLPYLLDALWPLWDDENRAIHDMIVETRVVSSAGIPARGLMG